MLGGGGSAVKSDLGEFGFDLVAAGREEGIKLVFVDPGEFEDMVISPFDIPTFLNKLTGEFMGVVGADSFLLVVEFMVSNGSPFIIKTEGLIEDDTVAMELGIFVAVVVVVKGGDLGGVALQKKFLLVLFGLVVDAVFFYIFHRGTDGDFMSF